MPYLPCSGCGRAMEINIGQQVVWSGPNQSSNPRKIIGSAICRECKAGTGFEIVDNLINYVSGKSSYGIINSSLSEIVKTLFSEAEMCFRNGSPDAAVAMCRSSIDIALTEKGISGGNLYNKIENAKKVLSDIEIGLAHASRLVTNDAIHNGELMALSDIPSILSATVRILNKLSSPTA